MTGAIILGKERPIGFRVGGTSAKGRREGHTLPEISRFLGIVVAMYYKEHGPAHFHATYGEHRVSVEVESKVVRGTFPARAQRHVIEWAALHEDELRENWSLARAGEPLNSIPPLE